MARQSCYPRLYGTIVYTVRQATQEIGIRKALGAQAGMLLRQVLAGVVLLLLTVAASATLVPALRASRIDPMVELSYE